MTDTCFDAHCVALHDGEPGLWYRDIPENMPIAGRLNIRILRVPDLSDRESCFGWKHYIMFQLGNQRLKSPIFDNVRAIRDEVMQLDMDGRSHFVKLSAHTHTWLCCFANLLNGSIEIPIHSVLEDQGIETQMYYKHRFHRLLDGSLRMLMWIDQEREPDDTAKINGRFKEHAQHPLQAWHRGAYDAVLREWLRNRVVWTGDFCWDLGIFIANEHMLLGIWFAHHWNPLTHRARLLVYLVSMIMAVFVLSITYAFVEQCLPPDCDTNVNNPNCLPADPHDSTYIECQGPDQTYWCNENVQSTQCKRVSPIENYGYIALGAFVSHAITKFLIFFAECRCAKWIRRDSERAKCRRCLEESGRFMMLVGVLLSILLLALGIFFTIVSSKASGNPDAEDWFKAYFLQLIQQSFYDLGFCFCFFLLYNGCQTWEQLEFMEDDEYFRQNPHLEHIEIKKSPKKPKRKQELSPFVKGKPKAHKSSGVQTLGEYEMKDLENQNNLRDSVSPGPLSPDPTSPDPRSPQALQPKQPPPTIQKAPSLVNKLNNFVGDDVDNKAARPEVKKFKLADVTETKEMKKMKVRIPANARPGGLLKVKTPEGISVLIRLPTNIVPGESEMVVDYAIHKKK